MTGETAAVETAKTAGTTGTEETTGTGTTAPRARERADLLETLARHRFLLRFTLREVTDEQAAARTTVSALCLGGLIKHVAATERAWMDFVLGDVRAVAGPAGDAGNDAVREREDTFRLLPGETVAGVLAAYDEVARRTERIVAELDDLDVTRPLPSAPWFEPGARWSARRVLLHLIAETAQHAGHADIIREALDGAKSMG